MDFWIGDHVSLKSGKAGVYMGKNPNGKARVKVDEKIVLADHESLSLLEQEETHDWEDFLKEIKANETTPTPLTQKKKALYSLDLHLEKLAPHLENENSIRILDVQLEKFQNFIDESYRNRRQPITIIHGRGEGVLRKQVLAILDGDHRVIMKKLINNDGAVEVWFRF